MSNELIAVDTLAYGCSDHGELADKIVEQVNLGNVVTFDKDRIDSCSVFFGLIEEDSDTANDILTSLSAFSPLAHKYAQLIDEETQKQAEEASASYEGKFDE